MNYFSDPLHVELEAYCRKLNLISRFSKEHFLSRNMKVSLLFAHHIVYEKHSRKYYNVLTEKKPSARGFY